MELTFPNMEASFATPSSSDLEDCENVMTPTNASLNAKVNVGFSSTATQAPLFTAANGTVQYPLVHYALLEQEIHLASESNDPAAESRVWTRWGEVERTSYQGIPAYTVSVPLPTSKNEGDGEGETPPELSGYGYTRFRGGRIKPVLRDALGYRPESAFWTFRDVEKGEEEHLSSMPSAVRESGAGANMSTCTRVQVCAPDGSELSTGYDIYGEIRTPPKLCTDVEDRDRDGHSAFSSDLHSRLASINPQEVDARFARINSSIQRWAVDDEFFVETSVPPSPYDGPWSEVESLLHSAESCD